MSSDAPTTPWHPAMMPNLNGNTPASVDAISSTRPDSPSPEDTPGSQPDSVPSPQPIEASEVHENPGADDWFPNYEAGTPSIPQEEAMGQELGQDLTYDQEVEDLPRPGPETAQEPELVSTHPEEAPFEPFHSAEAPDVAPVQQEAAEEDQSMPSSGPKHVSSDSFARTVSHHPVWIDDDEEPDFSLPRTETDLFNKYMPPNDRTNSFPVVPQSEHQDEKEVEPLPTNQAEDVINEIEHQSETFDLEESATSHAPNALQQDSFWGDNEEEVAFITQGGDLQGPEEEASDARFAEGLPLINHQEAEEDKVQDQAPDPFSQDITEDGDDFFNQIADGANSPPAQDLAPGQLERKSTMQVLNGLGADDRTAGSMLEDTVEEEEEEEQEEEDEQLDRADLKKTPPTAEENVPSTDAVGQATQDGHGEDLVAKWSEAFAGDDDDEFLLEDETAPDTKGQEPDPSAFFLDDDEGFLEDTEEIPVSQPSSGSIHASTAERYLPAQPTSTQASNLYLPGASPALLQPQASTPLGSVPSGAANPYAAQTPPLYQTLSAPYGAVAQRPAVNKAQSFVDKSKGGYSSPYDLPMEVVKPRKRASQQQLSRGASNPVSAPPPPPRSVSMYSQGPPATQGLSAQAPPPPAPPQIQSFAPGISPPPSNHSGLSPSLGTKPPQSAKPKTGFFEDLPMSNKVRPASRTSNKGQPSPLQASFGPQGSQPSTPLMPTPPHEPSTAGHLGAPDLPKLVPPPPGNPYASLPSGTNSAAAIPPPGASRYSPALSQGSMPNGAVPPPISRYSPAPPAKGTGATPPTALPHLPRTSSPLAHFEVNHNGTRPASGDPTLPSGRTISSSYEPKLNRMPSLPPTHEVEEEDSAVQLPAGGPSAMTSVQDSPTQEFQYDQLPMRTRQTPPPPPSNSYNTKSMSPPKRKITYGPAPTVIPPPRSQTGSPGAMYGLRSPIKPSEMVPRPLSAYGPSSPSIASMVSPPATAPAPASAAPARPRAMSQKLNLIPPTDGREHDPLQRWKGCPLMTWGISGMVVTSFPVDVPRYGVNQPGPMIVRSPGEVKVKTIKEIQPLEERLAKFPGPLRGKSKKKETIAWLTSGIQELEKGLPILNFPDNLSHEEKRAVERVLLWKILSIFVEHDGILEGNPTVEKAVRDVLSLTPTGQDEIASPIYADGKGFGGFAGESSATQMQPDSVDSGTIQQLKKSLLGGEREKAVWDAADKRLWGHALLIANTVSPDLYHKVSQEFIKKEVNFPGHNNESLAAFYAVLSGNYAESVDELVPVHARAGVQMVASSSGPTTGGVEGLEKWRETLTLVLSNRSTGDVQALQALGNLLSEYGRAEAAHICFLFARSVAIFGGLDDQQAQFVLVGADHRKQAQQSFKESEALLLSEVYEYGLSLSGAPAHSSGVAHLAVYKLQHAMTLAEYGYRDKALQYCDMLVKEMSAQTRRSPYHHVLLESAVEDLRQRILQAPNKDSSGSWISKPNMGKVSDSMWNRFNKFVAGEENDAAKPGSPKFGEESGPFARLQGGTPTISRPASASNATGMEMFGSPPGYIAGAPSLAPTMSPQMTRVPSRYSPLAAQPVASSSPYEPNSAYAPTGRSSMERTSGEYNRSLYEPRRLSSDVHTAQASSYTPSNVPAPTQSYPDPGLGISSQSSYQPTPLATSTSASAFTHAQTSTPMTPAFAPHNPFSQNSSPYVPAASATATSSPYAPTLSASTNKVPENDSTAPAVGYQPSSYGYEPPSMEPVGNQPPQSSEEQAPSGGYEAPSYQPYGFEPHSYQPEPETKLDDDGEGDDEKPKKKSFMDGEDDYFSMPSMKPHEKTKEERDKENEEMFRKVAEEEAKRAEAEKASKAKKGWGLGSWFGGGSKKESLESSPNKPIRAKLGEKSSFVYDPEQKRWVNKAAGAEDNAPKVATPPPPRATPRPAGSGTPPPPAPSSLAPPSRPGSTTLSNDGRFSPGPPPGPPGPPGSVPPPMMRAASNASSVAGPAGGPPSAPPSRPTTSMSHASSIDDLLGAAVPRKGAASRNKKKAGGRYVDVMAK